MGKEREELKEQADEALRALAAEYGSKVYDIEQYIEALEAAQPRWISVKERLPEENKVVLTWAVQKAGSYRDENVALDYHERGRWRLARIQPTHWLPLPPAPEEEG